MNLFGNSPETTHKSRKEFINGYRARTLDEGRTRLSFKNNQKHKSCNHRRIISLNMKKKLSPIIDDLSP